MVDKTVLQQNTVSDTHDNSVTASQLSALVDDELDSREGDLLMRRLCRDPDLQMCWQRYHLIRDAMQGQLAETFDTQFVARVRQAVDAEPLPASVTKPLPTWSRPAARWGVAASVVLATLFGLKQVWTDSPVTATNRMAALSSMSMTGAATTKGPAEKRLNHYLVSHNGFASRNNMQGMLPYVRMVGYQNPR